MRRPVLDARSGARSYNVLLLHGEVEGMLAAVRARRTIARPWRSAARSSARRAWDYVALGHYHVYRQVAPNAFYSGSIDYTSTNTWGELAEERDGRAAGARGSSSTISRPAQHTLPSARRRRAPFVDLPADLGARADRRPSSTRAFATAVDACAGGIDDKIVRLVVRDVPRHIARELDHKALREFKRRALHFHLDTRRPEIIRSVRAAARPGRRPSLADTVRDKLRARDADRATSIATRSSTLGLDYLAARPRSATVARRRRRRASRA